MKKKFLLFISLIILAGAVFLLPLKPVLVISSKAKTADTASAKCYYSASGYKNGFIISYTHSVNKGRVHDYYRHTKNNKLELYQTKFVSYGAGIPEPEETPGAVFFVSDNCYTISNLHRELAELNMAVGLIAKHSISFEKQRPLKKQRQQTLQLDVEYFFTDFFPPQTGITLKIKRVNLADYIFQNKIN